MTEVISPPIHDLILQPHSVSGDETYHDLIASAEASQASRLSRASNFLRRTLRGRRHADTTAPNYDFVEDTDSDQAGFEPHTPEPESDKTSNDPNYYSDTMQSWRTWITQQETNTRAELANNSANAATQFKLLLAAFRRNEVRESIVSGETLAKAINRKYGDTAELRSNEENISHELQKLRMQSEYAQNQNTMLLFYEDIDPNILRGYLEKPGELGESFRLPKTNTPTTNPEEAAQLLNTLPFVHKDQLRKYYSSKDPAITLMGAIPFPTERLIGVDSFESWAGRGSVDQSDRNKIVRRKDGMGQKHSGNNIPDIEKTSRGAIVDAAQYKDPPKHLTGNADILIFEDSDGERWGIAMTDGSHRAAAAKLRGEPYIYANSVTIHSESEMPRVDFSVKQQFEHH